MHAVFYSARARLWLRGRVCVNVFVNATYRIGYRKQYNTIDGLIPSNVRGYREQNKSALWGYTVD